MNQKKQYIFQSILLFAIIFVLAVTAVIKSPTPTSAAERRSLPQFPVVDQEQIESGRWMSTFETYTTDQFPFREGFRSLKALIETNLFFNQSNNDVFEADGHLSQIDYPLSMDSLDHAITVIQSINDRYLEGNSVYLSIVPDKNYYLSQTNDILAYDYDSLFEYMQSNLGSAEYIDITESLDIDDYYFSDIHWRQEALGETAALLLEAMGQTAMPTVELENHRNDFHGVYVGRYAKPFPSEDLNYLNSSTFTDLVIFDYENNKNISIYQTEPTTTLQDPYSFFLHGSLSLISIDNPNASSDKELIIFRDSFTSAIAPLLTEAYSRITLVDIRYLASNLLESFIDFEDQDVLFLYSTSILNSSRQMK